MSLNKTLTLKIEEHDAPEVADRAIRDVNGKATGLLLDEDFDKLKTALQGKTIFTIEIKEGDIVIANIRSQAGEARGDILGEALNKFGKVIALAG